MRRRPMHSCGPVPSQERAAARRRRAAVPAVLFAAALFAVVFAQCGAPVARSDGAARGTGAEARGVAAFATVYEVLQHPRCKNCHPAGDVPLQGDDSRPHGQNVRGGKDGAGLYALRCVNCHRDHNTPGANQPPGAPGWHLPTRAMPMVFVGRSPAELARQLVDPQQNGGKTREQVLHHVEADPLVLWGWAPGDGRTPVGVPHDTFVAAMREWIECGCPVPR